jgi:hypothetical protein
MVLRYLIAQHRLRLLGAWERSLAATDEASEGGCFSHDIERGRGGTAG